MDLTALDWVREEIADSLSQARDALEAFADGPEASEGIHECAEVLHEVAGVLQMLEFHGVSLLMDEMESVARDLAGEHVDRKPEACELLMRGIAQLPEYIDYVRTGRRDNPLLLMPLLNDLRSVRGATLLSNNALFAPDLWAFLPDLPGANEPPKDELVRAEAAKLRPFFHKGLVGWFRGAESSQGIGLVAAVVFRLAQFLGPCEARRLWWVAAGVASALRTGNLNPSTAVKRLLGQLDRELKQLADLGSSGLDIRPPEELLKNLLYYVAIVPAEAEPAASIHAAFGLGELVMDPEPRDPSMRSLVGPNRDALRSVSAALKEDLSRVKDSLDSFVRDEHQPLIELAPQTEILHRVADTLGLLNLGGPRRAVLDQAKAIRRFREERTLPTHEELMEIARALLHVDSALETLAEHGVDERCGGHAPGLPANTADASAAGRVGTAVVTEDEGSNPALDTAGDGGLASQLTGIETLQLLGAVIAECKTDLAMVKDAIATFVVERAEFEALREIPARLRQVEGSLEILSLTRARGLLAKWREFVQLTFLDRRQVPEPELLDILADAVVSLEYYLDAVSQARPDAEEILDRVETGIEALAGSAPRDVLRRLDAEDPWATSAARGTFALELEAEPPPEIPPGLLEDLLRAKELLERIEAPRVEADAPSRPPPGSFHDIAKSPPAPDGTEAGEPGPAADPELVAVFLEEAEQVRAALSQDLPRWSQALEDDELLIALRRGFHTLKGSGRVVGAGAIADFAWSIENVLNRVIERALPRSPAIVALVVKASELLPGLFAAFAQLGAAASSLLAGDVAACMAQAERLARPGGSSPSAESRDESNEVLEGARSEAARAAQGASILSFPDRYGDGAQTLISPGIVPFKPALEGQEPNDLGRIFADEAGGHLDELEGLLGRAEGTAVERGGTLHAPLMRIFHTLHGGARAAGMVDIAAVSEALESYLVGLRQGSDSIGPRPLGTMGLTLVHDCFRALRTAVGELRGDGAGRVPGARALLARIGVLVEAPANPIAVADEASLADPGRPALPAELTAQGPSVQLASVRDRLLEAMRGQDTAEFAAAWDTVYLSPSERDELLQLFLDEAAELLETTDRALIQWQRTPSDSRLVPAIQRDIHTLKGGARVANLASIGDLAHALEGLLILVDQALVRVGPELFDLLQRAHDRLGTSLDRARVGESTPDIDALIDEIDDFVSPVGFAPEFTDREMDRASQRALAPTQDAADGATEVAPTVKGVAARERVNVSVERLDAIVGFAGEISIAHGRIERFVGQVRQNLGEMDQTVERLRDQLRRLEIETESQILFRHRDGSVHENDEFDPLELDRFSNIQQLSRALSESVGDLSSIRSLLDEITGDSEGLLVQQSRSNADLQRGLLQTRMLPFSRPAPRFRRIVRETARELDKQVSLSISGEETRLDRNILSRMQAPLEHMLRNAVDHGIEPPEVRAAAGKPPCGHIAISLSRDGQEVVVAVTDDGAGMDRSAIRRSAIENNLLDAESEIADAALLELVLQPAVTTASSVTQISGRGLGMDVVSTQVRELGGTVQIASTREVGTTVTVRLPLTLAVNQALLVNAAAQRFAIPLQNVEAVIRIRAEELEALDQRTDRKFEHAGASYQFALLWQLLGLGAERGARDDAQVPIVLIRAGDSRLALVVDELAGRHEVVMKPVGAQLASIGWYAGATILGDGRVVLVFDVAALIRAGIACPMASSAYSDTTPEEIPGSTVMVVDDSITVRRVTDRLLTRNGLRVVTARDGLEALALLQDELPDIVLLDIEMPRMDGFELATALRDDGRTAALPIVMITSRTGDKHTERAKQIGVDGYLGKPYQESELLGTIADLLARRP